MNMYTNTKKSKKFILVLVLLILVNFTCPNRVNADIGQDIIMAPAKIAWYLVAGVLQVANNFFVTDKVDLFTDDGDSGTIGLTPENIIKGKFLIFDANIFNSVNSESDKYLDSGIDGIASAREGLRNTIASWYYALRNLAIVALLSVLVYVGIRMIMTSIAQDKAKYKTMFKDWLIALCLLILMHYIMISILNICTMITEALGVTGEGESIIATLVDKISGTLAEEDYTNDMVATVYANLILLGVNIFFMIAFSVKYLKREFTVIFLILLGPISCITYPIDKISDGKAQAFNKWFSEFMSEVLIQPFHLLLYLVLMGSAVALLEVNMIYTLVCLAVLYKSEDFVKDMFGIKDKLGSPLGAAATGAALGNLMSKGMNAVMNKGKGSGGGIEKSNSSDSTPNHLPPKTVDKKALVGGDMSGDTPTSNGVRTVADGSENDNDQGNIGAGAGGLLADNTTDTIDDTDTTDNTLISGKEENEKTDETGKPIEDDKKVNDGEEKQYDGDNNTKSGDNSSEDKKHSGIKQMAKNGWDKTAQIRAIHAQKMAKKYGTTNRGKRWVKRAGRGAKALAKAGLIGGLGAAAVTGLLLTGNGQKALGVMGGLATYGALKGKKAIKGATGSVKDYHRGLASDDKKEKIAFKDYEKNSKNIDNAVQSFRENHDGRDPNQKELAQEVRDRFELSRYGLKDDQIDHVLPIYQEKRDELLKKGMSEEEAESIAGSYAKFGNKYASFLKPDQFFSEAKMGEVEEKVAKQLKEEQLKAGIKCSDEKAHEYARTHLLNAARIHGISPDAVALPPAKQKVTLPSRDNLYGNLHGKLKFGNDKESEAQRQQVQAIQDVLIEVGFDDKKIEKVMDYSTGNNNEEIIASFATNVKYIISNDIKDNTHIPVGEIQSGTLKSKVIKNESVMIENLEKLGIEKITGVTDEKAKSKIRALEQKEGSTAYREIAGKALKGELSKNDKNNLSEKNLEMISKYKSAANINDKITKKKR